MPDFLPVAAFFSKLGFKLEYDRLADVFVLSAIYAPPKQFSFSIDEFVTMAEAVAGLAVGVQSVVEAESKFNEALSRSF